MSWQKCPLCNGTGLDPNLGNFNTVTPICPTCNGQRIISEVNGLPPGIPTFKSDRFCDVARFVMKHRLKDPQITIEEVEKLWEASK